MSTNGEYIVDRLLPTMVRQACERLGYEVRSFSDDWVLEIIDQDISRRIIGYKFDLNASAAAAIASDKVATYQMLSAYGVPATAHYLMRTKAGQYHLPEELADRDIVIKPLTGTSGHGVRLFSTIDEVGHYVSQSGIEAWAISPYVEIQQEVRTILLDGAPLLTYEKVPATTSDSLTLFNLGQGATPRDYAAPSAMIMQAVAAVDALGLRLAAVDCVLLPDKTWQVLEVNDGIMMEHYARSSPRYADRARHVYQQIVETMMTK